MLVYSSCIHVVIECTCTTFLNQISISLFCTTDLTVQPLFQSNLDVLSTTGDFFLNISIVANPFVIPANISVQTPPGVTLPPFFVTGKNDTGTAYVKIDLFQLPQYAGSYNITFRHPAVSTGVIIQFTLTVLCKFLFLNFFLLPQCIHCVI